MSAIEILRIYWLNVESLSLMNQSDCGATSLEQSMQAGCAKDIRDMVINFSLMKCLSGLMANSTNFGERSIRMVKSLMCFSKNGEMPRLLSDFSNEC